MKRLIPSLAAIALLFLAARNTAAQAIVQDSVKFNYPKIYSLCLDANVSPALAMIRADESKPMTSRDRDFKASFESRFGFDEDKSDYLVSKKSALDSLLAIFHTYWRVSLLDTSKNNDSVLLSRLNVFLHNSRFPANSDAVDKDRLGAAVKKYIESRGFHTTDGIGKTGRLYDLLVWKTEKDTTYIFKMGSEKIKARVIMMDGFLTLGWEEYATLGKLYPGGWTTTRALYCVKSAYDLNSETFLISYLAHEGRHFSDYKLFPKLGSADLEYRAKLTELSLAKTTLYTLLAFFINNANGNSQNGHSVANYRVISDLSKALLKTDFETNIDAWKKVSAESINDMSYQILQANTKELKHRPGK